MKPIKVVDSIMGSGKTMAAIKMVNDNPKEKYIYVTPFLKEVKRIKEECSNHSFYSPENYDKNGKFRYKMNSFCELLAEGKSIVATHALFKEISLEIIELIAVNGYILILDEVMDVIDGLPVSKSDQKLLIDNNIAFKDEQNFFCWDMDNPNAEKYSGRFADLKRMALNKNIMAYSDKIMIWTFPHKVFQAFKECYVLTYLFEGQIQKHFFDLHRIPYEKYSIQSNGFGGIDYSIIKGENYQQELEIREQLKEKIHIYEGNLNKVGERETRYYSDLSKSWYNRNKKSGLHNVLKNNVDNYFRNIVKAKASERIWTTFKDYQYNIGKKRYQEDQFLACNARATNEYKDRKYIAYTINRYMKPLVINYFDKYSIKVNQDLWAVSEMIQFIWRSAIRDGEEISIYIPSRRMRGLLEDWLDGKDIEAKYVVPKGVTDDKDE